MICHNCGSDLNGPPNVAACPHTAKDSAIAITAASERQLGQRMINSGASPDAARASARYLAWEHTAADVTLLGARGATPAAKFYPY